MNFIDIILKWMIPNNSTRIFVKEKSFEFEKKAKK